MDISICSYSFHRLLADGKQDIFGYITACKTLGCTFLDPWNGHLPVLKKGDAAADAAEDPLRAAHLDNAELEHLASVKAAAASVGLPFGLIAVDGAHIYESDARKRSANRARAYRWLEVAGRLGARQVRIDAGGPEEMPDEVFGIICDGYRDLIARGSEYGLQILIENHWGPSKIPDNVIKILENVQGLGLLLDTHNWKEGLKDEGRRRCAAYATATHIKTLEWDAEGNEIAEDIPRAIGYLKQAGYRGCWGIESCPKDGQEMEAARRSVALVRRLVR